MHRMQQIRRSCFRRFDAAASPLGFAASAILLALGSGRRIADAANAADPSILLKQEESCCIAVRIRCIGDPSSTV